jgi:hypothetical protein
MPARQTVKMAALLLCFVWREGGNDFFKAQVAAQWIPKRQLFQLAVAALKDTLIEKDLGIDGIRESVLYVAGVGLPTSALVRQQFS